MYSKNAFGVLNGDIKGQFVLKIKVCKDLFIRNNGLEYLLLNQIKHDLSFDFLINLSNYYQLHFFIILRLKIVTGKN